MPPPTQRAPPSYTYMHDKTNTGSVYKTLQNTPTPYIPSQKIATRHTCSTPPPDYDNNNNNTVPTHFACPPTLLGRDR